MLRVLERCKTKRVRLEHFCACLVLQKALLARELQQLIKFLTFRSVHFHPAPFTRPSFSIFRGSGSETREGHRKEERMKRGGVFMLSLASPPRFVPAAEAGSPEREEEKEEEVSRVDDRRLRRLRERQVSGHTRRSASSFCTHTPSHTHTITHMHTQAVNSPLKYLVEML